MATWISKHTVAYALGLAAAFAIGGGVGRATVTPKPVTVEIPPPSLKVVSKQLRQQYCVQNKAFVEFQNPADHNVRRQVDVFRVEGTPLSESGIICLLEGEISESTRENDFKTVVRSPFTKALIVADGGEAEFVSLEFATALSKAESHYQAMKSHGSTPRLTAQ